MSAGVSVCVGCGEKAGERYGPSKGLCWGCWEKIHNPVEPLAKDPGYMRPFASENGAGPDSATLTGPAAALAASRVDLLKMIRDGIPPREFVAGSNGMLVKGKRHHIAAAKKVGKSLTIGVVAAVDWIIAGATVVILDRENGSDEYARRMDCVLKAQNANDELREQILARYRYHAWPQFRLEWGKDASYPAAFAGVDVVIFDSSRKFLTSVNLKEDSSDDYSLFTDALIDPLMNAGITTIILDNTPHDADRARGTSSKGDLCDLIYVLKAPKAFSRDRAGRVELEATHSRIGEVTGTWALELGAGSYGTWAHMTGADTRKQFHEACVAALQAKRPQGRDPLLKASRDNGAQGTEETQRGWLAQFVGDAVSPIAHDSATGYTLEGVDE